MPKQIVRRISSSLVQRLFTPIQNTILGGFKAASELFRKRFTSLTQRSALLLQRANTACYRQIRAAHRVIQRYFDYLRSNKRALTIHVSISLTALLFLVFGSAWIALDADHLEKIGAYLTGVGQLVILIWIVATFYMQKADLHDQREELSLQRRALQLQATLVVYRFHSQQLERLARFMVEATASLDVIAELSKAHLLDRDSNVFAQFLLDDDATQEAILAKLNDDREVDMKSYVTHYVSRYKALQDSITEVDRHGTIRQALLSDTPTSELYWLLSPLVPGTKQIVDDDA